MTSSWYTAPTAIWNEIYWHLLIRLNSVIRFHGVKGDQFRGLGAPFKTWSERYISSPRQHHQPALTPFLSHSTFSSLPALPGQGWITVRGFNYRQTSNIDCFTLELIKLYGFTVVQVYIQYPIYTCEFNSLLPLSFTAILLALPSHSNMKRLHFKPTNKHDYKFKFWVGRIIHHIYQKYWISVCFFKACKSLVS